MTATAVPQTKAAMPAAAIATITAAAFLLQGANGLLQALLPLRMQADGLTITDIGYVAAAYGVGCALGCMLAPPLVRTAVVGAFAVGLVNGPVLAVASVYGVAVGLAPAQAALLLLAVQAGSLVFQLPLGWLSDRVDRRTVIAGLFLATAVACGAIVATSLTDLPPIALVLGFGLYGGLALCIYAVCVAHACDLVAPEAIVPTVSSLLVCWAIGATLGPLPATALMQEAGPQALFLYVGAICLVLALFVAVRMRVRTREAPGAGFVNVLATSAVSAQLAKSERPEGGEGIRAPDPEGAAGPAPRDAT